MAHGCQLPANTRWRLYSGTLKSKGSNQRAHQDAVGSLSDSAREDIPVADGGQRGHGPVHRGNVQLGGRRVFQPVLHNPGGTEGRDERDEMEEGGGKGGAPQGNKEMSALVGASRSKSWYFFAGGGGGVLPLRWLAT